MFCYFRFRFRNLKDANSCMFSWCITTRSKNCTLSSARTAELFTITGTKLYVPVVTLKTENNAKLWKLLNEVFKRSVYWNKFKIILKDYTANENIRERLEASCEGITRCHKNVTNENLYRKHFLPRLKIKNYNIEIDGRNFYINRTRRWLHYWLFIRFCLFWKKLQIKALKIAADLSRQKLWMETQEKFIKLFLLEKQIIQLEFITLINN